MEEIEVVLERHEQQIKTFERDMTDMKTVQAEIRSMHIETHFLVRTSPLCTRKTTPGLFESIPLSPQRHNSHKAPAAGFPLVIV